MDHYHSLGLSPDCTAEDIKNAYKRLALKFHPDKPSGDRETFAKIEQAYKTLSEPALRASHDNELANAARLQHPVWQVVSLTDMVFEDGSYSMDCRCGTALVVDEASTADLPVLIECEDCSTTVRIDPGP